MNAQHLSLDRAVVEALRGAQAPDEVRGICQLLLLVEIIVGHDEIDLALRDAARRFNTIENGLGPFVGNVIAAMEERRSGDSSPQRARRHPIDGAKVGHEIRGALGYFPGRLTGTGSL